MEKKGCAETVFDKVSSNSYPCSRKGGFWHKEKIYCLQHYPPEIERRRDAKAQVWQEEVMAEATVSRLNDAAPDLLAALKRWVSSQPQCFCSDVIACPGCEAKQAILKAEGWK